MSLRFEPKPELLNEILAFADLTQGQVHELRELFAGLVDRIERPDTLLAVAIDVVEDIDVARSLIEQVISINQFSRQVGTSVQDFIEIEIRQYADSLELDEELASRMRSALDNLSQFSDLVVFQRTSKAIELSYDCDNLLQRTRIMTDVRPLFTDDANDIDGAVVSHTLRISYDSAGNDREMSLALDESDLRKLISDCERALMKGDTARRKMCDPSAIPTLGLEGSEHVG